MADDAEKMRIRRERAAAWAKMNAANPAEKAGQTAAPTVSSLGADSSAPAAVSTVPQRSLDSASQASSSQYPSQGFVKAEPEAEMPAAGRKRFSEAPQNDGSAKAPKRENWQSWATGEGRDAVAVATQKSSEDADGAGSGRGGYGWRHMEGGIGSLSERYGTSSASAQQEEMELLLDQLDEDYSLPRDHQPQGYIDSSRCVMATMDKHIPEENKGYQMLVRMGWKYGDGLGSRRQGCMDPVPLTTKDMLDLNSRVGLGRIEMENEMHELATDKRRDLESEIQAFETEERKKLREERVIKDESIKQEIKEIISTFYCEICDKQYSTDSQFQEHLNSYDHHHKKRFAEYLKEQKAMKGGPSAEERQKKELKRMEKEMAARAAAAKAAAAESAVSTQAAAPVVDAAAQLATSGPVKLSFGAKPKGKISMGAKPALAKARPAAMSFGDDSD